MRFGQDRYDELEDRARDEGWPTDWRMDHGVREANRLDVLAGRMAQDLWVFAYGSLIWDPAVHVEEYRYGTLQGWHRSFCMCLEGGRGSMDQPGLMLALDAGGQCDGVVFRIAGPLVDRETEFMWRREMFSGSYRPVFLKTETPQGPIDALTFVIDPSNRRYVPDLTQHEAARMIAVAEGELGENFSYLESLVQHLDELGLEDAEIHRLHELAKTHRDQQT